MTKASGWTYHNPVRIRFGAGRFSEVPALAEGTTLIVTTAGAARRGLASRLRDALGDAITFDRVTSNPTIEFVEAAIAEHRRAGIATIVALGGGSAIDVGKVLSLGLAADDFTVAKALDAGHPWAETRPIPLIAVPTTAGTGSEATPFATLWDGVSKRKVSLGTNRMHPTHAVVDPELALSLPWDVTLSTGLDAFSQCFEAVANRNAIPVTTAIAIRGLQVAPTALQLLRVTPHDLAARTTMAEVALLSGLAISHTRTGLAHSMSYPVTAHRGVPHGLACALNLPAVAAFMAERDDGTLAALAQALHLDGPDRITPWILELYEALGVREAIAQYMGGVDDIRPYAEEMFTPGRADNSPRPVGPEDIGGILDHTAAWFEGNAA